MRGFIRRPRREFPFCLPCILVSPIRRQTMTNPYGIHSNSPTREDILTQQASLYRKATLHWVWFGASGPHLETHSRNQGFRIDSAKVDVNPREKEDPLVSLGPVKHATLHERRRRSCLELASLLFSRSHSLSLYIYIYMCVCVYVYHPYVYIYIYIHIMYACMYVCIHACMYK